MSISKTLVLIFIIIGTVFSSDLICSDYDKIYVDAGIVRCWYLKNLPNDEDFSSFIYDHIDNFNIRLDVSLNISSYYKGCQVANCIGIKNNETDLTAQNTFPYKLYYSWNNREMFFPNSPINRFDDFKEVSHSKDVSAHWSGFDKNGKGNVIIESYSNDANGSPIISNAITLDILTNRTAFELILGCLSHSTRFNFFSFNTEQKVLLYLSDFATEVGRKSFAFSQSLSQGGDLLTISQYFILDFLTDGSIIRSTLEQKISISNILSFSLFMDFLSDGSIIRLTSDDKISISNILSFSLFMEIIYKNQRLQYSLFINDVNLHQFLINLI